jgi:hypothetical protein
MTLPEVWLSAYNYQNTGCDGEDRHYRAQSGETEVEQGHQPGQDKPDGQQQHPDVPCHFHWRTPWWRFLTGYKVLRSAG